MLMKTCKQRVITITWLRFTSRQGHVCRSN